MWGPTSDVCWFIKPLNLRIISIIIHSRWSYKLSQLSRGPHFVYKFVETNVVKPMKNHPQYDHRWFGLLLGLQRFTWETTVLIPRMMMDCMECIGMPLWGMVLHINIYIYIYTVEVISQLTLFTMALYPFAISTAPTSMDQTCGTNWPLKLFTF